MYNWLTNYGMSVKQLAKLLDVKGFTPRKRSAFWSSDYHIGYAIEPPKAKSYIDKYVAQVLVGKYLMYHDNSKQFPKLKVGDIVLTCSPFYGLKRVLEIKSNHIHCTGKGQFRGIVLESVSNGHGTKYDDAHEGWIINIDEAFKLVYEA